jgi:hypothetical protein
MAETSEAAQGPNPGKGRGGELWVLAALAAAGLCCVCGLAVALVLILGRGGSGVPSSQANPIINIGMPPAATPGTGAPKAEAAPPARRDAAQDLHAVALPLGGDPKAHRDKDILRGDAETPPSPGFPHENPSGLPGDKRVFLRVRTVGDSAYSGKDALPMPIRYSPDATGKVDKVFAGPASALPGAAGPADLAPPIQTFADASADQAGWGLTLSNAHATASLDGYRSPDGFHFFTARVHAVNQSKSPAGLDADSFEIRDADGVRYLSNPELNAGFPPDALASGAAADLTLSFLVPASAELRAVALLTGLQGPPVLLPLSKP